MKKKIIIIGVFAVVSFLLCMHVFIQQKIIKTYTYTEIEYRGYTAQDISNIKFDHSYFRRILGYNEWRISVEFEKEPNVFFWFTNKDNKIIFCIELYSYKNCIFNINQYNKELQYDYFSSSIVYLI